MFESPHTYITTLPSDETMGKKKPLPRTPETTQAIHDGAAYLTTKSTVNHKHHSLSNDFSIHQQAQTHIISDATQALSRSSIEGLYDRQTPLPNESTTHSLQQPVTSSPMYQLQPTTARGSNSSQNSLVSRHSPLPSRNASFSIEGGAGWSESHFDRPSNARRGDSLKIEQPPTPVPSQPHRSMPANGFQKPFDPTESTRSSMEENRPALTRDSSPIELHSPNTPDDNGMKTDLDEAVSSLFLQNFGRTPSPAHLASPAYSRSPSPAHLSSPVYSRSPSPTPSMHSYHSAVIPEKTCSAAFSQSSSSHRNRAHSFGSTPIMRLESSASSPPPPPPTSVNPFPWASISSSPRPSEVPPFHKPLSAPSLPPHPTAFDTESKPRLSIASFSLTHDKDSIKTYRRMATKTRNKEVQMTYTRYLLDVAELYDNQKATKQRLMQEASYWIDRLARANMAEALLIKGRWLLSEDNTVYDKPDPSRALRCYLTAAKSGSVEAHYELAQLWKRRQKYAKAVASYKNAAAKGHPAATYKMAKILLRGQLGQEKNIELGLDYLRRAADMPGAPSAEPAFVLSCIYSDELECIGLSRETQRSRKDGHRAIHYLRKATELGYTDALFRMGHVHEQGLLGQPANSWLAYQCFLHASQDEHPAAMLELARFFVLGIPGRLASQPHEAFRWCQRAADKDYDKAEYILGTYYEDGIGTMPDYPRALEYFNKAASKGYALAAGKLNRPVPVKSQKSRMDDDDDATDNDTKQKQSPCYIM